MKVDRRLFLAGVGGLGVGYGLGGVSHIFPLASPEFGPDWSPREEQFVASTCLLCPSRCGIVGRIVDGSVVRIDGNPLHPISRGGLCAKGKAGLQLLYHPSRLTTALEREEGTGFRPVEWDTALDRLGEKLAELRENGKADAVAYVSGDVGATLGQLIERFLAVYGSPHSIREDYDDGSAHVMELTQGRSLRPSFDLERASMVLSFGAPLSEAWWSLPQAARARAVQPDESRRWVQADTRLSRTAAAAHRWLPVRPGTYGTLALTIAYVLLKEGLYDSDWIHRGVTGFDDEVDEAGRTVPGFRSLVLRHGRPDSVADRIGLPVETIVQVAKEFGRSPRPLAVWDHAVMWRAGGLDDALAIHALNLLSGSLQRPGGVYFEPPDVLPSLEQEAPMSTPDVTGVEGLRATDWADRILAGTEVEVLFLHQSNPVASAPDPDKVKRALDRIPLVVSFSPFLDETAQRAHLVLPDHTYLERWQDAVAPASVPYSVWGLVQPVTDPMHDTRATGDVLLDLAARMDGEVSTAFPWPDMETLIRQRTQHLAAMKRGNLFATAFRQSEGRELATRGWWIPHDLGASVFWSKVRETGGWSDPYYDDVGRTGASERADRRVFLPPPGGSLVSAEAPGTPEYPLLLVPYRVLTLASGSTPLMPWLLENPGPLTGAAWEAWVEVNPSTAKELDLVADRKVRVVSEHGEFQARLKIHSGAQPGVVTAPYGFHSWVEGWGSLDPANPLAAVGDRRDPVTGMPDWYSTHVRVEVV